MSDLKRLVLDFYRDTKAMIDELEKTPPPAGSPEEGLLHGLRAACRGYEGRGAGAIPEGKGDDPGTKTAHNTPRVDG